MADLPPSWRDHRDEPIDVPDPPGRDAPAFYTPIGDFQGQTYRRNAFAQGTAAEVEVLADLLGLRAGQVVLDVGCGDGRHLRALAAGGIAGIGVDVSGGLLNAAAAAARAAGLHGLAWVQADGRRLPLRAASCDAALSLCQGALGTHPATDPDVLRWLVAAVRPGGRVAFAVFHLLAAVRNLVAGDAVDTIRGIHHHHAEVVGPDRTVRRFDLWTAAYTAREAVALARAAGLHVLEVRGIEPGRYAGGGLGLDAPEILVIGQVSAERTRGARGGSAAPRGRRHGG